MYNGDKAHVHTCIYVHVLYVHVLYVRVWCVVEACSYTYNLSTFLNPNLFYFLLSAQ